MTWPTSSAGIKTIGIFFSFVFLFVVAVLLDLQYLYLMAVTLAVLPITSFTLAHLAATRFTATRLHVPTAVEGHVVPVTLDVVAQGGLPQGALRLQESLPPEMELQDFSPSKLVALDQWDGSEGTLHYHVVPQKRGVYALGPTQIQTTDPLGLFAFNVGVPLKTEMVVHPTPLLPTTSRIGGEGQVGRREREGRLRRGEGMDFHGVREYRVGDSLRRVHWPTTARTGKLSVIEFERAFQQDVIVVLDRTADAERGEGRRTTLEYAVKIAATLVDRSLQSGGGVTFVTQGTTLKIGAGAADLEAGRFRIFDALARVTANATTSLELDLRALRIADGAYIVLISSAGDAGVSGFLAARMTRGDRVRVYFVEPSSFGPGPRASSPAVAGSDLRVVTRADDPWIEGGKSLEHLLHELD